jgi:predicted nucleic acid-binding protein
VGLIEDVGSGPVCLDTAIVVYFIEESPTYFPLVSPLFDAIDAEKLSGAVSAITLLETLVVPFRIGDRRLAFEYEAILTNSRGIEFIDLGRPLLRLAAELRAATGVKTPDALQLAAAFTSGCTTVLTNDRRLPDLPGLEVIQLRDYLPKE